MHITLDLIGVFTFGISGALLAIQRDFDIVGIAILAVITALGGGILRDLILGDSPPLAFDRWEYLAVALASAAVTFVAHPELKRITPWGDSYEGFAPSGRTVEVERRYLWALDPEGAIVVEVEVRDAAARTGVETRAILAPPA